jgi:hypothetical protein
MSDNQVLIQIRGDVADINAKLADLKGHIGKVNDETKKLGTDSKSHWAIFTAGIAAGIYALKEVINQARYFTDAYMESEDAAMKLAVAMRNQGDYTKEAYEELENYAKQIQETTRYEDDQVISMMANLKTYGMTNKEVKAATATILDFATAKRTEGMSIDAAGELIGKAYIGNTERLKRYGVVVDQSLSKSEKFAAAMTQLNDRFGGAAQADLETYSGRLSRFKNQMQDLAETIGFWLLKIYETLLFVFSMAGAGFWKMVEKILEGWGLIVGGMASVSHFVGLDKIGKGLDTISNALKSGTKNAKEAGDAAIVMADKNYKAMASFDGIDKTVSKMKPGKRFIPVDNEGVKEAQKAQDTWAKTLREIQADIDKIELNALDQKLIDIAKKAQDMRAGIPEKLSPGKKKEAGTKIDEWESTGRATAIKEARKKTYEDYYADQREQNKKILDLNRQLTEAEASELDKRLMQADDTAEQQRIIAVESWDAGVIDYDAYAKKIIAIDIALGKTKAKVKAEAAKASREAEINNQLAELDLAEKLGKSHIDTLEERIRLQEELVEIQEAYLTQIDKLKDPAGWLAQQAAITQTKGSLAGLTRELQMKDPLGAAKLSLQDYANSAKDTGKQIYDAISGALNQLEDSLVDFCKTGKLSFSDLVDSIVSDLLRIAIRSYVTGPLAGMLGMGFFHSGGIVGQEGRSASISIARPAFLPRYHSGIGPNERLAVLQNGEGVFTAGQMKALGTTLRGGGTNISVPVTVQGGNKSLTSDLRRNIERTVEETLRRHT